MFCIRFTFVKSYTDHGLFKVPQKERFSLEMLNLVVMFATIILNISLCFMLPWENEDQDQSGLPTAIVCISISQAIVLLIILANSIYFWTRGGLSFLPFRPYVCRVF